MDDHFFRDEDSDSNCSSTYSDVIDSDLEAELYSIIHHQETLSSGDCVSQFAKELNKDFEATGCDSKLDIVNGKFNFASSSLSFISNENKAYNEKSLENCLATNENTTVSCPKLNPDSNQNLSKVISTYSSSDKQIYKIESHVGSLTETYSILSPRSKQDSPSVHDAFGYSDSDDSIIWIEDENNVKKNLQVNMVNEEIDLISDSSDSILPDLQMKNFCSSPVNRKKRASINDDWYIDEADQQKYKKKARTSKELSCTNCYKKGHIARFCSAEKCFRCFLCGGDHSASQCENRICSKCYNMGHDSRICCMQLIGNCQLCKMPGHKTKDCPDHWRRYYLTTQLNDFICGGPLAQDRDLYCFACGYVGHMGSVCKHQRLPNNTTWPCVISYNPTDGCRKQMNSYKSPIASRVQCQNQNVATYRFPKQVQDFINERRKTWKDVSKTKKPKVWEKYKQRRMEQKQKNMVSRDKDFPRTPKPQQEQISFQEVPEIVEINMKKIEKNRKKQKRRKANKEKRKNKLNKTIANC